MTYHRLHTPPPPSETEIDTPQMAESATLVAAAEADLAMLSRLAEIGMALAEAQGEYAKARLARAAAEEPVPLKPGEDATGPFNKIAQTVRRTIALKGRITQDLEQRRAGLTAERTERRSRRAAEHRKAVTDAIDDVLTEAFTVMYGDAGNETDEGDALWTQMLRDKENLLVDLDEFSDWLDRPVGETVARLCVALNLPADTCVRQNGAWWVKRPPSRYEAFRETRDGPPSPPSPSWGGTGREASRVGNTDAATGLVGFIGASPP